MAIFRSRLSGRRLAIIDEYQFPGSVRQRFALQRDDLGSDDIRLVEGGTRQWFRLAARHPKARLAMPSVIVDDLWHEFVLHTREYAEFCEAGLGRFLHHVPESAMTATGAAANRSGGLQVTFQLAQQDELARRGGAAGPAALPLLFRVDQELAVAGGRRYLADCGGRGECYESKGTVCLQHVGGPGRRPGGGRWNIPRGGVVPGSETSTGCGGG